MSGYKSSSTLPSSSVTNVHPDASTLSSPGPCMSPMPLCVLRWYCKVPLRDVRSSGSFQLPFRLYLYVSVGRSTYQKATVCPRERPLNRRKAQAIIVRLPYKYDYSVHRPLSGKINIVHGTLNLSASCSHSPYPCFQPPHARTLPPNPVLP